MTVRREIAQPRRETGARSPEDLRRTRWDFEGSGVSIDLLWPWHLVSCPGVHTPL